jgi:hypothetical protein
MMNMKKFSSVVLIGLAVIFAGAAPSIAKEHGAAARHFEAPRGHVEAHRGVEHHDFDRHRDFDRGPHGHVFVGVAPSYWWDYPEIYSPPVVTAIPTYWYYCPSVGAYYPYTQTCPEPWVPVPAS